MGLQTISQNGWHRGVGRFGSNSLKVACRRPKFPVHHDDFTPPHHHNFMVWWSETCLNLVWATQRQDLWPRMVARATVSPPGAPLCSPGALILAAHPPPPTHPPEDKKALAKLRRFLQGLSSPPTTSESTLSSDRAPAGKPCELAKHLRPHRQKPGRQAQLGFAKCGHTRLGEWKMNATGRGTTH